MRSASSLDFHCLSYSSYTVAMRKSLSLNFKHSSSLPCSFNCLAIINLIIMHKNLIKRHFARLSRAQDAPKLLSIVDSDVLTRINKFKQSVRDLPEKEFIGRTHEYEVFLREKEADGFSVN